MFSTLAAALIGKYIFLIKKRNKWCNLIVTRFTTFVFSFFFPHYRKLISCLKQALIYTGENDKTEKLKNTMTVILQSLVSP